MEENGEVWVKFMYMAPERGEGGGGGGVGGLIVFVEAHKVWGH